MSVASSVLAVKQLHRENDNNRFYPAGTNREERGVCHEEIINALRDHGFCLVQSARTLNVNEEKIMTVADERRFALSSMAKRMMSESIEEGYVASAHKEMFHFTSSSDSVQTPEYWHIPTAPGSCFENVLELGEILFNGINAHGLNLLRDDYPFEENAFSDSNDYVRWINAVKDSSAHVMTSFHYKASNPELLHAAAHVDKGVLSICTNPEDLEVCVKGEWISLGTHPEGVVAVLNGYTLERATNGLFTAARHRVRNNGRRLSRVMKLRLDPSLVVKPASVIACVPALLCEDLPPAPDSLRIRELMQSFAAIHSSVNAPNMPRPLPTDDEARNIVDGFSLGNFDVLPSNLVLSIFDWLRNVHDLFSLSLVSHSLHRVANSDVLCIPAAESSHIDWGGALDRIDRSRPSHVRAPDDLGSAAIPVQDLIESVSNRWLSLIGAELTDSTRLNDRIEIIVRDQYNERIFFRLRFNTRLQRLMMLYAQKKGVSVTSLRFLLDGTRINGDDTCFSLEMEMSEILDCMLEQTGD